MQLRSRSPSRYRDGGIKLGRATANAVASSGVSKEARIVIDAMDNKLLEQFQQYLKRHSFTQWEWCDAQKLEDHWRVSIAYTGTGSEPRDSTFVSHIQRFPCFAGIRSPTDFSARVMHVDHVYLQLSTSRVSSNGGYLFAGERRQPVKLVSRRSWMCRVLYIVVLLLLVASVYWLGLRSMYPERYA